MVCAIDSKDERNTKRRVPQKVESEDEVYQWEREVQSDPDLADNPGLKYLLWMMTHPDLLIRETWRLYWSTGRIAEVTGRSRTTIDNRKEELIESKYLRRTGTGPIQTGRGEEEVPTYALVLPPNT